MSRRRASKRSASTNTAPEKKQPHPVLRFKVSFGKDHVHDGFPAPEMKKVRPLEVRAGHCCLLDGFPCRITRIDKTPPGKMGHVKRVVSGVGLMDQKKHSEWWPEHIQAMEVPTVMESDDDDTFDDAYKVSSEERGLLPPFVDWRDEEHVPQDEDHFVLTTTCIDTTSQERATSTIVWSINKKHGWGDKSGGCYKLLLGEQEEFISREQNKIGFYEFLCSMNREQSPSAILGQSENNQDVLERIFGFACGPLKYRPDPYSYSILEYL